MTAPTLPTQAEPARPEAATPAQRARPPADADSARPSRLGARIALALVGALLAQSLVSALVLHMVFFSDPQQAELRKQLLQAFFHLYGLKPSPWRHLLLSPLSTTLLSALVVGAVTLPLMHRLTRRLQRLQRGVQALGNLDLGARVAVEGGDEVAALAVAFNQAAERIEALVRSHKSLLAYTSHELRTPLARLRMTLESLEREAPGAAAAAQRAGALAEARRDLAELDHLIGSILMFSRLDAGATHALQLEEVDVLAVAAEEASREDIEAHGDWVRMHADERLVRHAIRNLLSNARKHAGVDGAQLEVQRSRRGVRIFVRDQGPGVPLAQAERVFEPFIRLGGTTEGSGLGLALVRRIARLHGGDAHYEANPGGGACFVLDLAELRENPPAAFAPD